MFITCWIVYGLHFATNIPREVFPALSLGDHWSFRVDEYGGMHNDIFNADDVDGLRNDEGRWGYHIGNNPGVSMLAAIPYTIAKPVIDLVDNKVKESRKASGAEEPPKYDTHWPMAQQFYAEAYRRGLDVKLALGSWVMHAFLMAPSSALGAVAIFLLLAHLMQDNRWALGLALLYAFGTPVFFRTGFLNHNLMLGHIAFIGMMTLWNFRRDETVGTNRVRAAVCGLTGGTAILFDYSGVIVAAVLFAYCALKRYFERGAYDSFVHSVSFGLGALPPILLLWFYQWASFGNPFLPGQHWMPPVEWIELGYQGFGAPQPELFVMLGFDYRFGLFVACPLFILAAVSPFLERNDRKLRIGALEFWTLIAMTVTLWVFFSGSNYTKLQFNTGIRYLAPVFPFLFIPVAMVLRRLPARLVWLIGIFSVALAWATAMYRDVERGLGVADPVVRTALGGFELPAIRTVSNMEAFQHLIPDGASSLALLLFGAVLVAYIWAPLFPWIFRRQRSEAI
ncbi:MAG: hypothetical protein J5I65_14150 [Aridibacter famidurans]|nr:hypothetical protein [Aridibacter famidurans]